ncbi:MAG: sigma-70 family RNA polymerase sigma factor [Lewinella sp.]|nr:sigma-70 family RNA polymerase sigma factor [Lewinella sp.]
MLRFLRGRADAASDAALLERFQVHEDQEALARLFDRHLELIYGLCLRYLATEDRAEDAVLAIYTELVEKLGKHDIHNFRSWLHTYVRNHCLMQLRREKHSLTVETDPGFMQSEEVVHPIGETSWEDMREGHLDDCLPTLSEQQKTCIELFYYQGKSYKEIAEDRAEPLGQVRSNIQNGRRNLRLCIEAKMRSEEEH